MRLDRDPHKTGKVQGGGVCLYVNTRWCKTVVVRETACSLDIELLTVSLRPREFPQLFMTVVYIHPKANVDNATSVIIKMMQHLQSISPDAPNFIMGYFNHCSMAKSLSHFFSVRYLSYETW